MATNFTKKPLFCPYPGLDNLFAFHSNLAKHQHDKHSHEAFSIIMVTHGKKTLHLESRTCEIQAGQVALINPGQVHGCEPCENELWAHQTFYASASFMHEMTLEFERANMPEFNTSIINDNDVIKALGVAHDTIHYAEKVDQEVILLNAFSLLIKRYVSAEHINLDQSCSQKAMQKRVRLYQEILSENRVKEFSLAQLAEAGEVTRFQVIRDFQNVLHISPNTYFKNLRLQYAKDLMRSGNSLSKVAILAGYSDQSHFSRSFKRVHGFSPKQFQSVIEKKYWSIPL